ncbi:MAG: hypothetical protein JNK58_08375, partial [Phycisphaerae bacterium]|nr:hypothetical protein [Phycisphaerae bacterium]
MKPAEVLAEEVSVGADSALTEVPMLSTETAGGPRSLRDRVLRFVRREVVPFLAVVIVLMTFRSS